ncbi:DsbA family oxidoreductase [Paenibacillus sp. UNC499MF]|uniref:DsbA family oxidoreductase n=1 Tax=Paenibacillus sp. UNC499MF TaxID=1502751 RepID=UPI0008A04F53|nr:DsbA family oxidoreductase [Paenibacillus sp. UNC499MF]SEG64456.1 Predicted dithiol-disulfide isomerase, DsbA family [Paenibacillus sp. UNC499MF]
MKIEIWSDFACPFCYIGKRRFEQALEQFPHKDELEVVYRSFELDPNSPRDIGHSVHDMLSQKYGMSVEQAKTMNANVVAQAESVGLTYHMDTIVLTNTFDAHRLAHFADTHGKMHEMTERLLKAYFTDSLHLGDPAVLASLAEEVGLDKAEAERILAGDTYANEVRADEQEGAELGITGVPFFVIDRKYGISGAQPLEVFVQALEKAYGESKPLTILSGAEGGPADGACADGVCAPPTRDK